MAKAPVAVKTASVLAFERKLATSDAVMYAGNWQGNEWQPIEIQEKAVRGTISNRLKIQLPATPPNWMLKSKSQLAAGGCGCASGRCGYAKSDIYAARTG